MVPFVCAILKDQGQLYIGLISSAQNILQSPSATHRNMHENLPISR